MVKALHRAGIEVILDVVFNHTAEGGDGGPTLCFRGLANDVLLHPRATDKSRYADYTGCGNTLNANQPIVRRLIHDSLRYWVTADARRRLPLRPGVDPVARRSGPAAAEPAGALGHRVGPAAGRHQADRRGLGCGRPLPGRAASSATRWQEWNGRFRDDVRRFVRGDDGTVPALATRLLGSPDLYGHEEREAEQSINFVTCHDGFTLNDLVSYDRKHNEANGEDNRDGVERQPELELRRRGPDRRSGDRGAAQPPGEELPRADAARRGHADAAHGRRGAPHASAATTTPIARTTRSAGSTGACWSGTPTSTASSSCSSLSGSGATSSTRRAADASTELLAARAIEWHGVALGRPDWGEHSHSLAFTLRSLRAAFLLHAHVQRLLGAAHVRAAAGARGATRGSAASTRRSLTGRHPPGDEAPAGDQTTYRVPPRSCVVLVSPLPQGVTGEAGVTRASQDRPPDQQGEQRARRFPGANSQPLAPES